jgi:hypothetical protein
MNTYHAKDRCDSREGAMTSAQLEKEYKIHHVFQTWAIVTYNYRKQREHRARVKYKATTTFRVDLTIAMAPPKATGAATTVPRKSCTRALAVKLEIEETPNASSSYLRFPCDYILSRKHDAPPVTLQETPYYMLVTPNILEEVIIDEDILGKVPQLKYVDHEITNVAKFPELAPHKYLDLKVDPLTQQSMPLRKFWAK